MNQTVDRLTLPLTKAGAAATVAIIVQYSNDADLLEAWLCTSGEPGDAIADILAAEMEGREVAF